MIEFNGTIECVLNIILEILQEYLNLDIVIGMVITRLLEFLPYILITHILDISYLRSTRFSIASNFFSAEATIYIYTYRHLS